MCKRHWFEWPTQLFRITISMWTDNITLAGTPFVPAISSNSLHSLTNHRLVSLTLAGRTINIQCFWWSGDESRWTVFFFFFPFFIQSCWTDGVGGNNNNSNQGTCFLTGLHVTYDQQGPSGNGSLLSLFGIINLSHYHNMHKHNY